LTVDVDGPELIDGYEAAAARQGTTLGVRVQVDAGLRGAPPETVAGLARRVAAASHLRLAALTCYRSTYLRSMERDTRPFDVLGREEGELLAGLAAGLHDDVGHLDLVCGSSATAWGAARVPGVTEVVTGNGAVRDWGLARMGVVDPTTIAAGVVATVLDLAGEHVVVDAGTEVLGQGQTYPGLGSVRAATADGGLSIDETRARIGRGTRRRGWSASIGDRVLLLPSSISLAVANPGSTTVVTGSGAIAGAWQRLATDTPSMDVEVALAAAWATR
jgi:D-serine deaminase-like pyridoxal phosphate-dependent protein